MDLRTYLFKKKLKQKDVSQQLGISQGVVSNLVTGKVLPRKPIAKLFEYWSDGEVREEDWKDEN